MSYPSGSTPEVKVVEEYIIGPENTPFFTTTWSPVGTEPVAYVLFVHGTFSST